MSTHSVVSPAVRPWQEFGLFGGRPAFADPVVVNRPNPADRGLLFQYLDRMLCSGWLSNGPLVQEFEDRAAAFLGVAHCIAVANATLGLELVFRALGLAGEVVVPSYTFVATVHALRRADLEPVFCDVDLRTHNLDPVEVERLITARTSAVLGVHLWGRPCAIDALSEIAERRSLSLVFDAAHGFACNHGGRRLGCFGDAEVFSFHATKFFSTGEGGLITTGDPALADALRQSRNFGQDRYREVVREGTNAKMTEACAAMGLAAFARMPLYLARNQENFAAYRRALSGIPGIDMLEFDPREASNLQYVVVEVDPGRAGLTRDALLRLLHAEGCMARDYFSPGCHRIPLYSSHPGPHLPNTGRLADSVLVLPTGMAVSPEQITEIGWIIRSAVAQAEVLPWSRLDTSEAQR